MALNLHSFVIFGLFITVPDLIVSGTIERKITVSKENTLEGKIQQLQTSMDFQNSRFEIFEAANYALQSELDNQKRKVYNMERVIRHLSETVEKQRNELDFVYKKSQGCGMIHSDENYPNSGRSIAIDKSKSQDQNKRLLVNTITLPVAFQAYLRNVQTTPNGHQTIIFDNVELNVGNGYHPTSGVFIAPETGIYAFSWSIRLFGNASHSAQLMVGDQEYDGVYLSVRNGDNENVSGTAVAQLEQGTDVFVRTHAAYNWGDIHSDPLGRTSFCGWKIH